MIFISKNEVLWLTLVFMCPLVFVSSWTLIDENENIESIAKVVCETTRGTAFQLGRISSIGKLVRFLENSSKDNKEFNDCRHKHLEALVGLNYLLTTANDDACGDEKLKLIESYHRRFVLKVDDSRTDRAPKLANLLFMHFAKRLSSICEQQAMKVLNASRRRRRREIEPEELVRLEKLQQFAEALGMSDLTQGYNGIYLFWNMVESLPLEKSEKIVKYVSKRGDVKLNVQVKDAKPIQGLQAVCRYPLYSQSVLPVLRLIDMGYYPESRKLIEEIKLNPYSTSMFIVTQVCETLERIKVFEDETLEEGKIVAITIENAAKLPEPLELPNSDKISEEHIHESSPLGNLDQLLTLKDAQKEVEKIKLAVKSRAKVWNRMLRTLIRNLKGKFKSKIKNLYMVERNNKPQDMQEVLGNQLEEVEGVEVFDEETDKSFVRKRRGITKTFGKILLRVLIVTAYVVWILAMLFVKMALLLLPTIVSTLMLAIDDANKETAFVKGLSWLWRAGWNPLDPLSSQIRALDIVSMTTGMRYKY